MFTFESWVRAVCSVCALGTRLVAWGSGRGSFVEGRAVGFGFCAGGGRRAGAERVAYVARWNDMRIGLGGLR